MVNLMYNFYVMEVLEKIKNKLIISVQSAKNEPLHDKKAMQALIDTVVSLGKIDTLRLAGDRDIKYVRKKYKEIVIIGITKPNIIPKNYKELVYITPSPEDAKIVAKSGADIVAFDATLRNTKIKEIISEIHAQKKLAMGDIAAFEDAKNAYNSGVDIISTTLSGYTKDTENMPDCPDFELLQKCVKNLNCPCILEGKIWSKNDVIRAFELGAHAVVIGSAVTRPHKIIEKFKEGLI
ncbi:MAG: putative N-acetylmannosamine-6-phosphate 2-epimerase [Candidatus Gastranaerophilales bacterium]|nr:putative N-acetylmannosamine-6-phosphate 2-epimerase [Candidatus Gastranaerophilales bacterium]